MILESLPVKLKTKYNLSSLFSYEACKVSVAYCIIDPNKKTIIKCGSSRPCGNNHNRSSIHAEHIAINYCREYDKRNKYKIYIWRYTSAGKIKRTNCCVGCTNMLKKYNYLNKIFTFENNEIVSSVVENPEISLGYKIIRGF